MNIHLALNSIKFDADVTDWDDTAEAGDVYLPSNVAKGVSLNKTATTIKAGESETLTATVTPSDAVDKTVEWRSSDESVAKVENGVVEAIGEGTATITAVNNGHSTSCEVRVVIDLTRATSSHVAKFVGEDGYIYDSKEDAESNGTTAAGWIAYSTDDHHGLILAMDATATHVTWEQAKATDFSGMTSISGAGSWHLPTANDEDGDNNGEWNLMKAGIIAKLDSCPLTHGISHWSKDSRESSETPGLILGYHLFINTANEVILYKNGNINETSTTDAWACCSF